MLINLFEAVQLLLLHTRQPAYRLTFWHFTHIHFHLFLTFFHLERKSVIYVRIVLFTRDGLTREKKPSNFQTTSSDWRHVFHFSSRKIVASRFSLAHVPDWMAWTTWRHSGDTEYVRALGKQPSDVGHRFTNNSCHLNPMRHVLFQKMERATVPNTRTHTSSGNSV